MKILKHAWTFIFWLGSTLIFIGLSVGFVSETWDELPLGLIISGIVIVGLCLLYLFFSAQARQKKLWGGRATEAGTNAIAATLSVLIILGLVNFLALRYQTRIDLTENQRFTLSPQTQEILENLPQPVKVWLFDPGKNPQHLELLENYEQQASDNFSFEFVNPYEKPGIALEFGVKQLGEIYLESGDRREVIISRQLEPLNESKLTNSIEQILGGESAKLYLIQGHGERTLEDEERGLAEAVAALEAQNYIVETLNLAETGGIPDDADIIAVIGPQREFLEAEVEVLQEYLDGGGSLLLAIDYQTEPGLDKLLQDWGVLLDTRLAIDDPQVGRLVGLDPWVVLVTNYGEHPIAENFANGVSLFPFARPVESEEVAGITENPLIWTNERSWAEADVTGELGFNPGRDRSGPLSLGVAFTRSQTDIEEAEENEETSTPTEENEETSPEVENISPSSSQPSEEVSETNSEEAIETEETSTSSSQLPEETAETENISPPSNEASEEVSETTSEEAAESDEAGEKAEESRLVVFGNSLFATNGWFQQSLNGDVFLNSISWLNQSEAQTLSIRPKPVTNRRFAMTVFEARLVAWTGLIILPLFGFSVGGILWWIRR